MKFAAFIMTYERSDILEGTIQKLLQQTVPPIEILIVDNSATDSTESLIKALDISNVSYYKVGYNSGPAGAAYYGLKILAEKGYDWIYWGDDDDPPLFNTTFDTLLQIAQTAPKCGTVGTVGHFFDFRKGIIKRVEDEVLLNSTGLLAIDHIGGNQSRIVNGKLIREFQLYPDKDLFFGFEDLDIDLKIKKAGYHLYVDKELYLKHRKHSGRINFTSNQREKPLLKSYWREYYSTRSLLYIFTFQKLYFALFYLTLKKILKLLYSFKYGSSFGIYNLRITLLAYYHFAIGKKGLTIRPIKK